MKLTQNEYVYAICCRLEVAGDVIYGEYVKTIEDYAVLNFEVASFNSFQDIFKKIISRRRWTSMIALSERIRVLLKNPNSIVLPWLSTSFVTVVSLFDLLCLPSRFAKCCHGDIAGTRCR